jgi:hypothetical protein
MIHETDHKKELWAEGISPRMEYLQAASPPKIGVFAHDTSAGFFFSFLIFFFCFPQFLVSEIWPKNSKSS